jgi:hypothetical protein
MERIMMMFTYLFIEEPGLVEVIREPGRPISSCSLRERTRRMGKRGIKRAQDY